MGSEEKYHITFNTPVSLGQTDHREGMSHPDKEKITVYLNLIWGTLLLYSVTLSRYSATDATHLYRVRGAATALMPAALALTNHLEMHQGACGDKHTQRDIISTLSTVL